MIMQGRQVSRFLKLFDSLMMYCASVLDVPGLAGPVDEPLDGHDMRLVIYAVWGEGGDPSVIDRYLEANPDRVNRTDLREVASWKGALFEEFSVTRDGGNVYFMLGGYAFAVRGFDYEVDDDLEHVPTYAMTLLVPFDGIIAYGLNLVCDSEPLSPTEEDEVEGELAACKTAGHVVRTSRQFVQAAPLALAEDRARRAEREESTEAITLGPGTHEGALMGVFGEERDEAVLGHLKEKVANPESLYVKAFDETSVAHAPISSLRELLRAQTAKELRGFLRRLGVEPTSSHRSKRQLLDKVLATMPSDPPSIEPYVIFAGSRAAECLRDCYEAGGRMTIPESEITSMAKVPELAMPMVMSFHDGDEFCIQLFDEFMPVVGSMDLDELVEQARAVDAFVYYVDLAVDVRGVIALGDAIAEGADALGLAHDSEEDVDRLTAVLRQRFAHDMTGFTTVPYDGTRYLVASGLLVADGKDGNAALSDEDKERLQFVLEDQAHFSPRTVEGFVDSCEYALDWMMDTPEYRALMCFLDAHVPDGADDYLYAEKVVEKVFDDARLVYEYFIEDAMEIMEERGYVPTDDEDRATVVRLLEDFYLAAPKWQLNGWALAEMEAHEL